VIITDEMDTGSEVIITDEMDHSSGSEGHSEWTYLRLLQQIRIDEVSHSQLY